ncbi:Neuroligin-4, Y-linked [Chionoecetes opilio]|uniref:Neuroligin-4, Y-linked n=1 Tax=Chionoecetes opilio TaxID=41210 RepID=A0A8J4Y0M6_CHIOP|nr:Neuroligin-4, Y-linked [Chionoecetes opilio]
MAIRNMTPGRQGGITRTWWRLMLTVVVVVVQVTKVEAQFRNDRDHETLRDDYWQVHYRSRGYTTPPTIRTQYNSGDTYYGTDRRYDTRYDDPSQTRGSDNRYQDQSFRYNENPRLSGNFLGRGRYDARGRERPGGARPGEEQWDMRLGVLDIWRPDLQGELRPSEEPGHTLPLADIFVTTDSGKVQGFYVYLYDKPGVRPNERPVNKPIHQQRHVMNVSSFLGIPYAKPPLQEGRFKPPRHVPNWYSTWQALDYQSACPQNLKFIGASNGIRNGIHEDCLYLNVFSPSVSITVNNMYPVLFYIHGGDLDHGASSQFPGHMLAGFGEVVVVTFNYRLGALGFLSTGDANSPGNYGLMDMAMALEWVYTNIRFFNGDRNKITVFGPGAGGAMAGILAVLPRTKDYVSQVIAQSGSPLADWAVLDDVYRVQNTSRVYGQEVGCTVENSYKLLQCLNRRSYEELSTAPITPDVGTFAWSPVVDTNFTVPGDEWYEEWEEKDWRIIPEMPINLYLRNSHHRDLRYLAGVNRDAAANFVFNDNRLVRNHHEVTEEFFNQRVKEWVKHYNYSLNLEGTYDAIKWMYTYGPDPHNNTHIREQYVHMLSDALYNSGVDQLVKVLVNSTNKQRVPTYYYLLNTTVEALKLPFWREIPNDIEYYFITGAPYMDPDFYPENVRVSRELWSEGDRNISEFMMKTMANFAKWGNPTQTQVEVLKVKWEEVLEGNLKYLSINSTFNTTMHYNYRQPYNTFWTTYIPQVIREWVPTVPPPLNPWTQMSQPIVAAFYGSLMACVVLVVILFVCCGLWKSAKRQHNKAVSDMVYYKTDNEALIYGDQYSRDIKRGNFLRGRPLPSPPSKPRSPRIEV